MCGSALPSAEAYCGATTREEFPALRELFNQGRKNLLGDRPLRSTAWQFELSGRIGPNLLTFAHD